MDANRLSPENDSLADLVSHAEGGESVDIERDGRVVARIVPANDECAAKKPFDLAAYFESIKDRPVYAGNSVVDMRKEACY